MAITVNRNITPPFIHLMPRYMYVTTCDRVLSLVYCMYVKWEGLLQLLLCSLFQFITALSSHADGHLVLA